MIKKYGILSGINQEAVKNLENFLKTVQPIDQIVINYATEGGDFHAGRTMAEMLAPYSDRLISINVGSTASAGIMPFSTAAVRLSIEKESEKRFLIHGVRISAFNSIMPLCYTVDLVTPATQNVMYNIVATEAMFDASLAKMTIERNNIREMTDTSFDIIYKNGVRIPPSKLKSSRDIDLWLCNDTALAYKLIHRIITEKEHEVMMNAEDLTNK